MLVLVVSDNHGRMMELSDLVRRVKPDQVIHLGDSQMSLETLQEIAGCPLEAVPGNCDVSWGVSGQRTRAIEIGGIRALMTHGDRYGVGYSTRSLQEAAREQKCSLVMYGHTHIPVLEQHDGLTILNPGSLNCPRQADRKGTYALIEIDAQGEFHYTISHYERK